MIIHLQYLITLSCIHAFFKTNAIPLKALTGSKGD